MIAAAFALSFAVLAAESLGWLAVIDAPRLGLVLLPWMVALGAPRGTRPSRTPAGFGVLAAAPVLLLAAAADRGALGDWPMTALAAGLAMLAFSAIGARHGGPAYAVLWLGLVVIPVGLVTALALSADGAGGGPHGPGAWPSIGMDSVATTWVDGSVLVWAARLVTGGADGGATSAWLAPCVVTVVLAGIGLAEGRRDGGGAFRGEERA